ncbi:hypothetical protein AB6A40_011705 [Gnathostoma spinigerum]|uniref:Uncharacterized protein n=1 Tax=Gnathostoma spinigerum TaxID=75299 RepID=A0ABD6EYK0_9BILA
MLEVMGVLLADEPYFALFDVAQPLIDLIERHFLSTYDRQFMEIFMQKMLGPAFDKLGAKVTGDWNKE